MNSKRSTLQALQDELASLPAPETREPQQNPALASERQLRIATLGAALQSRLVWDRVFREISAVLPSRRLADDHVGADAADADHGADGDDGHARAVQPDEHDGHDDHRDHDHRRADARPARLPQGR